jgi:hypothetical protein
MTLASPGTVSAGSAKPSKPYIEVLDFLSYRTNEVAVVAYSIGNEEQISDVESETIELIGPSGNIPYLHSPSTTPLRSFDLRGAKNRIRFAKIPLGFSGIDAEYILQVVLPTGETANLAVELSEYFLKTLPLAGNAWSVRGTPDRDERLKRSSEKQMHFEQALQQNGPMTEAEYDALKQQVLDD